MGRVYREGVVSMLRVLIKNSSLSGSHEEAVFLSKLRATMVSAVTSRKLVKSEEFPLGEKMIKKYRGLFLNSLNSSPHLSLTYRRS